jgi:hypothetical protein
MSAQSERAARNKREAEAQAARIREFWLGQGVKVITEVIETDIAVRDGGPVYAITTSGVPLKVKK